MYMQLAKCTEYGRVVTLNHAYELLNLVGKVLADIFDELVHKTEQFMSSPKLFKRGRPEFVNGNNSSVSARLVAPQFSAHIRPAL